MTPKRKRPAALTATLETLRDERATDAEKAASALWGCASLWCRAAEATDGTSVDPSTPEFADLMDLLAAADAHHLEIIRPYMEGERFRSVAETNPEARRELHLDRPEEGRVWAATVAESPLAVAQWSKDRCVRLVAADDFSRHPHVSLAVPEAAADYEDIWIPKAVEREAAIIASVREINAPEESASPEASFESTLS